MRSCAGMHGCAAGEHCRRADLVVSMCAKPSRSAVRVASQARCSPCSGDWCRRASGAGTGAVFPGPSVFPSHRSPHLNRGCGERLLIFAPALQQLESEEGKESNFFFGGAADPVDSVVLSDGWERVQSDADPRTEILNGRPAWTDTPVHFMHTSPGDHGISVCVHDHPASGGVSRDSQPPPCPAEPCLPDTVPHQTTKCEWLCAPGW